MPDDRTTLTSVTSPIRPAAAVVLAAGRSTRMKSDRPKVMHDICGQPMLAYVLGACRTAGIETIYVVVGFGKEQVIEHFRGEAGLRFVEQAEQKGTAHAVSMCAPFLAGFTGDVVVIAGDMPLVRAETLHALLQSHRAAAAAASIATTVLDDPAGYGRIIRDSAGGFERIVEHRDCTPHQLAIREVNPSYYCFDAAGLLEALPQVKADNAKGEYYVTDVLTILRNSGRIVQAVVSLPAEDATGINSRVELAEVTALMQRRIQRRWMEAGVTIESPANTWIDSRVVIGEESVIRPFSFLEGRARIGRRCRIGPYAYVTDAAIVEDGRQVGPGMLTALTALTAVRSDANTKRSVSAARRPPAQSGCQ